MILSIRQTPLRVLFLAVAVVGLMTVTDLPSASPVHAQEHAVTATRDATGESPPARPTDLQASAGPDSVSLTWTASTDQTVTHYAVLLRDRDEDDAGVFEVIDSNAGSATSYTDRSVSPGGSYVYRVKAVSPTGVSQWSSYARADIPADPADLAPSGLSAKAVFDGGDSAGVALAWDAPAADAASVTGYEILRAVGDGDLATLVADTGSADTTYADDTATEAGERYAYRVKALRGGETSQPSGRAEATIPSATAHPVEPGVAEEQSGALWSATLTVADFGSGNYGCIHNISGKECSSLLAPDDFTYNGTTYQITALAAGPGSLYIEFLNELGEDAVDSFVLNAVGDTFSFQTPDAITVDKATAWLRDINAWDDGDVVSVSITVSGAEADEPAEGTTEGTTVSADWGLIPSGLNAGDRFRLLFRTSTTRDATSTDIADYDAFVQTAASNGHADIRSHGAAFRVLGSTADVDARDNTTTTYTADDKGVAVYWLNGNKVADDYEDFYDGTWSNADGGKDEDGNAHTAPQVGTTDGTYTGSNSDGT